MNIISARAIAFLLSYIQQNLHLPEALMRSNIFYFDLQVLM
ncbi:hypothetical protein [Pleurocapsa sp. PCC 7319]|nr:hypothetical protein [Pleurocapsa sp. PCC 7319]